MTEPWAPDDRFWNARVRDQGHTGWANPILYRYDQPARIRAMTRFVARLRPSLDKTRVLDVGCGVGDLEIALARRGAEVTGFDLSPEAIRIARARTAHLPTVRLECTGLDRLPAHPREVDVVTSVTVLQHVIDAGQLRAAVGQLISRLSPAGTLAILELAPRTSRPSAEGPHVRARSRDEWLQTMGDLGLRLVREKCYPHWGVLLLDALSRRLRKRRGDAPPIAPPTRRRRWLTIVALALAFPLDRLFRVPVPRRWALYRLMAFTRRAPEVPL